MPYELVGAGKEDDMQGQRYSEGAGTQPGEGGMASQRRLILSKASGEMGARGGVRSTFKIEGVAPIEASCFAFGLMENVKDIMAVSVDGVGVEKRAKGRLGQGHKC